MRDGIRKIGNMIDKAIADEERSGRLRKAVEEFAQQQGLKPTQEEIKQTAGFIGVYALLVPAFLEAAENAAQQMGLSAEMEEILQGMENYWFEADDLSPDHLGLVGILDDAYGSVFVIEKLSEYCKAVSGRPLIPPEFMLNTRAPLIRKFIGDPLASELEQRGSVMLTNAVFNKILNLAPGFGQMASIGFPPSIFAPSQLPQIESAVNTQIEAIRPY